MKEKHIYNEDYLNHLNEHHQFNDQYAKIRECKDFDKCAAYERIENGATDLADRCHVKLYRHPPRDTNIKLSQDINSLCLNKRWSENKGIYHPTQQNKETYGYNIIDGYLKPLIKEVIDNGFKRDLCLTDGDMTNNNYSIMNIVKEKLNCVRHKQMGSSLNKSEMLSIVLYTGSDANYDLCQKQRNGDYETWKWFDYCLYNAIHKLSKREYGEYKIYTGLKNVKLDKKYIECGYFTTYVSTSWDKDIALQFIQNEGMLIEIDNNFRENAICCDVSWISRYGYESEILIARSIDA
eukprot:76118_1